MPLARASDPLGGADALPFPSPFCGGAETASVLVVPSTNRPREADGHPLPVAGPISLLIALPGPCLALLGVDAPGDPAVTGCLPAAVARPAWCAAGGGEGEEGLRTPPPRVASVLPLCLLSLLPPPPPRLSSPSRG